MEMILDLLLNNVVGVIGIIVVVVILLIIVSGYVKASPDTAYIISGLRKQPKVLIGKAGIKVPFLEKKDELNLQLIPIDVKTSSAVPTADYININVDAAVNVKISDKTERLNLAAQNFLNKPVEYIAKVAREVLEGNMREIVGRMNLEEMVSDRQKFAELVKENAEPDLAKMGLDIVSFNVQNFVDGNGVIENLGVDNIVKIQKNAAISRAVSERDIAQAQARASQEANDAKVDAQTKIAERNNELAIKQAELKKIADAKQAEADAAYKIQEEQSRKSIEIATADANIMRQEKEIELRRKDVEVTEQELEAKIKKQAEADKFAAQQRADADLYRRQKDAEAQLFEQQRQAEAKKADAEAVKYQMEQEAAGIAAKGEAEAKAIEAKGIAEAEALNKKAEAMKKYGEAAVMEMYFNMLPKAVEAASKPLEKVDRITMFGEGNQAKLVSDIINTATQVSEGMNESMGIDLKSVLSGFLGAKVATKENKENDERNFSKDNSNKK